MLIKSNSVPNFLFEIPKPSQKRNSFSFSKPKIVSYGEFVRTNKNSTKLERINAIKNFYDRLFSL